MRFLVDSFLKGLLVVLPLAFTVWVLWFLVSFVDGLLGIDVPGLGTFLVLALVTGVGMVASNHLGRRVLARFEGAVIKVPVVKLLYASVKDLLQAFVGEQRRFDKPVMVRFDDAATRVLGFVTCTYFDDPKLSGHVAVYVPQSYNMAGNLLVVPRERVEPVDADGAQFLAFIMSGGVAEMNAARTVMDARIPLALRRSLRAGPAPDSRPD